MPLPNYMHNKNNTDGNHKWQIIHVACIHLALTCQHPTPTIVYESHTLLDFLRPVQLTPSYRICTQNVMFHLLSYIGPGHKSRRWFSGFETTSVFIVLQITSVLMTTYWYNLFHKIPYSNHVHQSLFYAWIRSFLSVVFFLVYNIDHGVF